MAPDASTDTKNFGSTSLNAPSILHISFADDPTASLGCQLANHDKGADNEIFLPGYAVVGRLLGSSEEENEMTVARKAGVHVGDLIVAVNGQGFRRFAPDYKLQDAKMLSSITVELDNKVIEPGSAYSSLLAKIKAIKACNGDPPLCLTLERYGWDAQPNSWGRFLLARENNVPEAMQMIQKHEAWRAATFPITLTTPGLQKILREKAVSEIDVEFLHDFPPTVYVNYGKLLELQTNDEITADDVVSAFVIFTERMLAKAKDPRHPKTCQFIDLSGVSISSGFRVETLKKIYHVFEPNYPETLFKMVMYPVSSMVVRHCCVCLLAVVNHESTHTRTSSCIPSRHELYVYTHAQATTARTMLSFVNEKTQKKFLITNNLDQVCQELGWNKEEVEDCGGVTEFMHKHEKAGSSMLFED